MIEELVAQGSAQWLAMRRGVVTASQADRLLTPVKRRTYALELLAEQLADEMPEQFVSAAMQFGIETEPAAAAAYELATGRETRHAGFVWLDDAREIGCSPDRWVGDDGLVEIKCPNTKTHLEYVIEGIVPKCYQPQVQFQLLVTGRKWCDFVSFDPRVSLGDLLIVRAEPDSEMQAALSSGASDVLKMISEWRESIITAQSTPF